MAVLSTTNCATRTTVLCGATVVAPLGFLVYAVAFNTASAGRAGFTGTTISKP
jgi:hypothetical protein